MKLRTMTLALSLLLIMVLIGPAVLADPPEQAQSSAALEAQPDGIKFRASIDYDRATLTVNGPDNLLLEKAYTSDDALGFVARDDNGDMWPDGQYIYEIRFTIADDVAKTLISENGGEGRDADALAATQPETRVAVATGAFAIVDGAVIYTPNDTDTDSNTGSAGAKPSDAELAAQVFATDVIVQNSLCVGMDCGSSYNFGFDTIVLSENNLRIYFRDTSSTASFPSTDWRLTANDSANGGAGHFSIDNASAGKTLFRLYDDNRANTIVAKAGRVGLGTATPSEDLHIWYGDTPTIRLDQSGSGWAPQMWDISGNETNFFIRDVTHSSNLPFRIRATAPNNALYIDTDGDIGLGSQTPNDELTIFTGSTDDATLSLTKSGGAKMMLWATNSTGIVGTETAHPLELWSNNTKAAAVTAGTLTVAPSAGEASVVVDAGAGPNGVFRATTSAVYLGTNAANPLHLNYNSASVAQVNGSGIAVAPPSGDAKLTTSRSGGASGQFVASDNDVFVGSTSNHPVKFTVDSATVATLYANGNLHVNGALSEEEDVPVSADIDGDGLMDIVLWRPSTGMWYIRESSSNYASGFAIQWGTAEDTPFAGDVDGDGKEDLFTWRPSTDSWYGLKSTNGYDRYNRFEFKYDPDTMSAAFVESTEGEDGMISVEGSESITALQQRVAEQADLLASQDARIAALEQQNTELAQQNADLEARLSALEALISQPTRTTR